MISIAVASPDRHAYSQTFVHQQVAGLPFKVHLLYGGNLPTHHALGDACPGFAFPGENADPWVRVQSMAAYLAEHQIAVVLAEFGPTGVEMMPVCAEAGVPLLVHFHGYDAWRNDVLASYGRRYPAMFQQAHAVIGVSREMCRQLTALGAPAHRVHHVPYGVDTRRFTGGDPAAAAPDFLMVGRQVDKKGHLLALMAFADLAQAQSKATLRIVGGGPLREAGEMLAQALGIADRVRWLGVLPPDAVARELRLSRALIQFSHTTPSGDREGTPVAMLEAMACGVPVIGARHAGILDVIEDEVHGLLVDPFDVRALAHALGRLASQPALAARLGQAAAVLIRGHYTQDRYIHQLSQLIESAMPQSNPTALVNRAQHA